MTHNLIDLSEMGFGDLRAEYISTYPLRRKRTKAEWRRFHAVRSEMYLRIMPFIADRPRLSAPLLSGSLRKVGKGLKWCRRVQRTKKIIRAGMHDRWMGIEVTL